MVGKDESFHDARGRYVRAERVYMRMPGYKWCYYNQNGLNNQITLHMREEDAPTASLFILKFMEYVLGHNIQIHNDKEMA